jgi:hypothetical protein
MPRVEKPPLALKTVTKRRTRSSSRAVSANELAEATKDIGQQTVSEVVKSPLMHKLLSVGANDTSPPSSTKDVSLALILKGPTKEDSTNGDKENYLSAHESIDEFASTKASLSLRICCYGSSSSTTPKVNEHSIYFLTEVKIMLNEASSTPRSLLSQLLVFLVLFPSS